MTPAKQTPQQAAEEYGKRNGYLDAACFYESAFLAGVEWEKQRSQNICERCKNIPHASIKEFIKQVPGKECRNNENI